MIYSELLDKHRHTIVNNFEPARCEENVFSVDELHQLTLYQFQNADNLRWTDSSSNIQPILNVTRLFEDFSWMQDKFESILKHDFSKHHTGNYYITTQLHDAHVDLMTEAETQFDWAENLIPYKSCIIPLGITAGAEAYTAFFKQRHIGTSVTFDRVGQSSQDKSMYKIAREYPTFETIDTPVFDNTKSYIFPHIVENNINEFQLESVFPFTPGTAMVFDACQLHASCVTRMRPNFNSLKTGINIQFYIRA
jgi:hypothetical protein